MRRRNVRWALTALVAIGVAFVALGGPAAAKHFINGGDIKPGTVGSTQLARGAVTASKLSRGAKRALAGRTGPRGATGPTGPAGANGAAGARGPAGAFNVVDAQGRVLGQSVGFFSGTLPEAYTADGAILIYDNTLTVNYPAIVGGTTLVYKQAGCAGPGYAPDNTSLPFQVAIVLDGPPVPGSNVYVMTNGSGAESFTYQSVKTSAGCTNSSGGISSAFPVRAAGTVPAVQKPLSIVPTS
ncbi:MAG TPA: hypothetical protein VFF79_14975 [Conexibacter sp.]|jgi:hypothetical protein|nr:hypothetical protein [Conexibacter sp.]